ncbi:hypothetical protein [Paenibacillus xylanexedens]
MMVGRERDKHHLERRQEFPTPSEVLEELDGTIVELLDQLE